MSSDRLVASHNSSHMSVVVISPTLRTNLLSYLLFPTRNTLLSSLLLSLLCRTTFHSRSFLCLSFLRALLLAVSLHRSVFSHSPTPTNITRQTRDPGQHTNAILIQRCYRGQKLSILNITNACRLHKSSRLFAVNGNRRCDQPRHDRPWRDVPTHVSRSSDISNHHYIPPVVRDIRQQQQQQQWRTSHINDTRVA